MLRCIVAQLECVMDLPVSRSVLPSSVRIQPRAYAASLSCNRHGDWVFIDDSDGSEEMIFPREYTLKRQLLISHVVDRGPTNVCCLQFAQHKGLLWTITWGFFHDMWNGVKAAAKVVERGSWWVQVLRFAGICNINHGPFRSGAWGRAKQHALRSAVSSRSASSPDFIDAAQKTSQLLGETVSSEEDYSEYWRMFQSIPSCHFAGPVLKFARWLSIAECWEWYRKEMWFLRLVLADMSPKQLHGRTSSRTRPPS